MRPRALPLLLPLLLAVALVGCSDAPTAEHAEGGLPLLVDLRHAHAGDEDVLQATLTEVAADQPLLLASEVPFERVALLLHSPQSPGLSAAVLLPDGLRRGVPVEWTWHEDEAHVGRILLDAPAVGLELHSHTPVQWGLVELGEAFQGDRTRLTRALPLLSDRPTVEKGGVIQPPAFVQRRSAWGARDPDRICGDRHTPDRITVHHTAGANNDNLTAPATLRQIQAFHIDSRGWCDIGYHFLVGRDGVVYQGRTWPDRTGAHVGGQNSDNLGVGFLGNFVEYVPPQNMLDAGARILGWAGETWSIPLDRERVRGHGERAATLCPGAQLLSRLEGVLAAASGGEIAPIDTATLIGFVRRDRIDNAENPVVGATVQVVDGPSLSTPANGLYRFDGLPLGPVTIRVSRACYADVEASRTLSAPGEQHWLSVPMRRLEDGEPGTVDCNDPACEHLRACTDPAPTEPPPSTPEPSPGSSGSPDPDPEPSEPPPSEPPSESPPGVPDAPPHPDDPSFPEGPPSSSGGAGAAPTGSGAPDSTDRQPPPTSAQPAIPTDGTAAGPPLPDGPGEGRRPPVASGQFVEVESKAGCAAGGRPARQDLPWLLPLFAILGLVRRRAIPTEGPARR